MIKDYEKGKITDMDILKKINTDTVAVLKIDHKLFSKKDNPLIDGIKWEKGVTDNFSKDSKVIFVVVNKLLLPPNPNC